MTVDHWQSVLEKERKRFEKELNEQRASIRNDKEEMKQLHEEEVFCQNNFYFCRVLYIIYCVYFNRRLTL